MALTIDELNIQITSDSSKASRALTSLIKKLEQLKGALTGTNASNITISNSFNKVTNSVNKADSATKKYDSTTKKTSKSTKSFSDTLAIQIQKWGTLLGAFKSAASQMGGLFVESNNYIETLNLFNVTMGDAAGEASKYAKSVSDAMGIDPAEWMQNQGVFKNLVSGFGVGGEAANTMSQNLTQLSYDMASFFNTNVETAFDKLSSAMSGQVKGLREFGIDTTVASLQEYALARGIDKSVRSMTQAEKSMLRYNYIMEKSTIMQGDMARTLVTPANALRILSAQLTQAKRALGNIVSVIVARFIPYVQVMVEVIADAANAIANWLGFELPKIDYSGLDAGGFAEDFEDAEDSLNGMPGAIKKIKKQLMGFDELNILSSPDSDSVSSGAGASGGGALDMKPLEYDFLSGINTREVDKIYQKLKKMVAPLKKIWNYLVDYEDTIKAIGGLIAGLALIKGIKKLSTALKGLKFVDYFLDGFSFIKAVGGNFFENFRGGLDMIRQNLSGIQRGLIVAAAGIVEFFAVKDSVAALVEGTDNVAANITTIGVVSGAAAIAMYTALGPAGVALAAVVGLAGAFVGVAEGMNTLEKNFVNTVVFDGYGMAIGEITGHLETLWTSISTKSNHINELGEKVKTNDEKISTSLSGITTYTSIIKNAGTITAEQAGNMSTDVSNLATAIRENLGYNTQIVFEAFANVSTKTAETLGLDVKEMTTILQTFQKTFSDKTIELEGAAQGYFARLANGEILSDEELKGFQDTLFYLNEMSGQTYANQQAVKRAIEEMVDVDFGSVEEAKQAINDIAQLGKDMASDIDEAYNNTLRSIDTLEGQAKAMFEHGEGELSAAAYNQFANVMKDYRDGISAGYEAEKSNIEAQLQTVYDFIASQANSEAVKVYDAALDNWGNLSWAARKLWYGDKSVYANEITQEFRETVHTPIMNALNESGADINEEGKTLIKGFFDSIAGVAFITNNHMSAELRKEAVNAVDGYTQGIKERTEKSTSAFKEMIKTGLETVQETQDSHSPAKEFEKLGKDAVLGYKAGVDNNFNYIENAFKDKFKQLFIDTKELVTTGLKAVSDVTNSFSVSGFTKALDSITEKAKSVFSASTWAGYAKNITNALDDIKIPTFKNIGLNVTFDSWVSADKKKVYEALGLSGFPRLNWYTYAQGGFPAVGEMFIAREAGPELVGSIGRKTAVANNDQIISGIESGVYRAMMAANSTNSGGSQTIRIINEIDGDVVGEKVIKYHNGKVIQTGVSPLLI